MRVGVFRSQKFSEFLSENVLDVFGTQTEQSRGRSGSMESENTCTPLERWFLALFGLQHIGIKHLPYELKFFTWEISLSKGI